MLSTIFLKLKLCQKKNNPKYKTAPKTEKYQEEL